MVYCTKCGTKNDEAAPVCVECGVSLEAPLPSRRQRRHVRKEEECFGLPHGGAIVGVIIGIIIVVVGISAIPGLIPADIQETTEPIFWAVIIIAFGVLVLAGALYGYSRKR